MESFSFAWLYGILMEARHCSYKFMLLYLIVNVPNQYPIFVCCCCAVSGLFIMVMVDFDGMVWIGLDLIEVNVKDALHLYKQSV